MNMGPSLRDVYDYYDRLSPADGGRETPLSDEELLEERRSEEAHYNRDSQPPDSENPWNKSP